MARLTRKQQKIFAESATNNGVFGSLQGNDPTISSDPDAIQSLPAFGNGWNEATYSAELLPPLEEFQSLQYLSTRQIAYLMQEGVAEWDVNTTYYKGSLVKSIQSDGSFILYISLIDNNQGNLVTDTTKWQITNTSTNFHQGIPNWRADVVYSSGDWVKEYDSVSGWVIYESRTNSNLNNAVTNSTYWEIKPFTKEFPIFTPKWFDYEVSDMAWLRADTFSWHDGTVYTNAYTHLVNEYLSGQLGQSETIAGITIYYNLAPDGHKIVDASYPAEVQHVEDIYNATGVAWYYILDTTNQRFKLPRENPNRETLLQTLDVTNPTGIIKTVVHHGNTIVYSGNNLWQNAVYGQAQSVATAAPANTATGTGDIGFGSTIGANDTGLVVDLKSMSGVFKGKKYLYFYVGQFSQTATEQTAGLNASLFNGKVDLDSSWGFPSSQYDDLTLGADGATYTAPADGWMFIAKSSTAANQGVSISNNSTARLSVACISSAGGQNLSVCLPAKKGDIVAVGYNAAGTTNYFRFIYAQKTN